MVVVQVRDSGGKASEAVAGEAKSLVPTAGVADQIK